MRQEDRLTYRQLRVALRRLDALPPGPDHDRVVEELRAALRSLPASEAGRLFLEVQRAALARRHSAAEPRTSQAA